MPQSIATTRVTACNSCGSEDYDVIGRGPDFEYHTCSNEFDFGRCKICGLVFIADRPNVDTLDTIYPPSYIPYHFNEHLGSFIAKLRNYVQKKKIGPIRRYAPSGSLIVDVGCGGGEFLQLLRDHGPGDWRLVGVDISTQAVEIARRLGLAAVQGRFESLDWPLSAPDVIVMNQVIEHLVDPKAVVRRSYALLRPGGILMMETPSVDAWDARMFQRRYWGGWHTPRHWTLYTPATLKQLAESAGFEVVEVTHLLSPNFWLQSVHHRLSESKSSLMKYAAKLFDVSNPVFLAIAGFIDVVQLRITGKTSNFRLVARRPV